MNVELDRFNATGRGYFALVVSGFKGFGDLVDDDATGVIDDRGPEAWKLVLQVSVFVESDGLSAYALTLILFTEYVMLRAEIFGEVGNVLELELAEALGIDKWGKFNVAGGIDV